MLSIHILAANIWYDKKSGLLWWKVRDSGRQMNRPAGSIDAHGYVAIGFHGKVYKAHRVAWALVKGIWPAEEVDHRNGRRADNRWKNLREATQEDNKKNKCRYKNNKSGYAGVSWHVQHKKWYATIQYDKKVKFLGLFTAKKKARDVYLSAAKKYHGKFARF